MDQTERRLLCAIRMSKKKNTTPGAYVPEIVQQFFVRNSTLCKSGLKCSVCGKERSIIASRNIRDHALSHGDDSWKSAFRCALCPYKSRDRRNVQAHSESHSIADVAKVPKAELVKCNLNKRKTALLALICKCFPQIETTRRIDETIRKVISTMGKPTTDGSEESGVHGENSSGDAHQVPSCGTSPVGGTDFDRDQQLPSTSPALRDGATGIGVDDRRGRPESRCNDKILLRAVKPDPDAIIMPLAEEAPVISESVALATGPTTQLNHGQAISQPATVSGNTLSDDILNSPIVAMIEQQLNFVSPAVAQYLLEKRIRAGLAQPTSVSTTKSENPLVDPLADESVAETKPRAVSHLKIEKVYSCVAMSHCVGVKRPLTPTGTSMDTFPNNTAAVIDRQDYYHDDWNRNDLLTKRAKTDHVISDQLTDHDPEVAASVIENHDEITADPSPPSDHIDAPLVTESPPSTVTEVNEEPVVLPAACSSDRKIPDQPAVFGELKKEDGKKMRGRKVQKVPPVSHKSPNDHPSSHFTSSGSSRSMTPSVWTKPPAIVNRKPEPSMAPISAWSQKTVIWVMFWNMLVLETADNLYKVFSEYGVILRIMAFRHSGQCQAHIQFLEPQSAAMAINAWDGQMIYNRYRISVGYSTHSRLQIQFNDAYSRDYTNPFLPTRTNLF